MLSGSIPAASMFSANLPEVGWKCGPEPASTSMTSPPIFRSVTLVFMGMPAGGSPCAVSSEATSGVGVSGSVNDSGTSRVPSLIAMTSMSPSLRRKVGTAARAGRGGTTVAELSNAALAMAAPARRIVLRDALQVTLLSPTRQTSAVIGGRIRLRRRPHHRPMTFTRPLSVGATTPCLRM